MKMKCTDDPIAIKIENEIESIKEKNKYNHDVDMRIAPSQVFTDAIHYHTSFTHTTPKSNSYSYSHR